jgi:glycosyltransferase involved in cell wall biosynthesis
VSGLAAGGWIVKVVFIQDYLRVGGTESQSLFLCGQVAGKGHEATLITFRPGGRLGDAALLQHGGQRKALQPWDCHLNWFAPGWRQTLEDLSPDVVVLMGRNANSLGSRIRKAFPDLALVGTMRTGRHLPSAYRSGLEAADLVICNSHWAAEQLRLLNLSLTSIEVHPNACLRAQELEFPGKKLIPEAWTRFCGHRKVILYVASFVRGKGHLALLKGIADWLQKREDVVLFFAGEGPMRKKVEQSVCAMHLGQKVYFAGFLPNVTQAYAFADVALSASCEESMPNALVEAQYAGLPVVAMDAAGVSECLIPDESGFLVEQGDFRVLAHHLESLLDDAIRLETMGKAARAFARGQFAPALRFEQFFASLMRVAGKSPNHSRRTRS